MDYNKHLKFYLFDKIQRRWKCHPYNQFVKMITKLIQKDLNGNFTLKADINIRSFYNMPIPTVRTSLKDLIDLSDICLDGNLAIRWPNMLDLSGSPKMVLGNFECTYSNLRSLFGSPQSIGGYFKISENKLKTLENGPLSVGGNFYASDNLLTDLSFFPTMKNVKSIRLSNNKLISLQGLPEEVDHLYLSHNNLPNLIGAPKTVNGSLYLIENPFSSLEGMPSNVGKKIYLTQKIQMTEELYTSDYNVALHHMMEKFR